MISVCMASHNGERFIKKQIDSILKQLGGADELIISDDGSTDRTIPIIEEFHDERIKLLHFTYSPTKKYRYAATYHKVTKNFENALKAAKGDYIFLADQDDIWMDDKVSECLPLLEKYTLIQHNSSLIDSSGKILWEKGIDFIPISSFWMKNLIKIRYRGCCMAFNRNFLYKILPIPDSIPLFDAWIGLLSSFLGEDVFYIEKPLICYRRYDGNTSELKSTNSSLYKLTYRLQYLFELIKRSIKLNSSSNL